MFNLGKWTILALIACWLAFVFGCAQDTGAMQTQPIRQEQNPTTEQQQDAAGTNVVNVYLNNATGNKVPHPEAPQPVILAAEDGKTLNGGEAQPDDAKAVDTRAGYVQIASVNVTVGVHGTETAGPQSSGAVGPQSAQPAATVTQSPEQKPEASTSVPVSVSTGPGSNSNASGVAGTGQSQPTLTTEQQAELRTLQQIVKGGGPAAEAAQAAINAMLDKVFWVPDSQPSK